MELRSRHRLQLRRAAMTAALGALLVPATAGAATKTPTITKVTPKSANVGDTLTIVGKNFRRGKAKNTVLFKRDSGKQLFVKAGVSTTRKLVVVLPKSLERYMAIKAGQPSATKFRLRVLAARLGKAFTSAKASPTIGPEKPKPSTATTSGPSTPDGDCDGDGVKNGADDDDDNDLLPDTLELHLGLDPCNPDTDGDGVEDGYEYQSALDLNDDDYQNANAVVPYPGKKPYPNPLYKDADIDYDGDGLTLGDEYQLWRYTYTVNHSATRTLTPLSYSDGTQYSLSHLENGTGRRIPDMTTAAYQPPQSFRAWADLSGYGTPQLFSIDLAHSLSVYDLYDFDRDHTVTSSPANGQNQSERYYWDFDDDGLVSDDERDEDADGLTNYDETHGRISSADWWTSCYTAEPAYPVVFAGTSATDADTDGDGILDGADDQDHDDVPNLMELSRNMASGLPLQGNCAPISGATPLPSTTPMQDFPNPFNPCLPDPSSRTCQRHPAFTTAYPPFDANWQRFILN